MASSPRRTNQTEKPPTASAPKPGAKARAVPGGPLIKTSSGKKNPALSAAAQSALLIEKLQEQQILLQLQNEQLQEANAELEISCHRLHDLYDLAPVGFMTFDEKGCVREINHTAAELFGYSVTFLSDKPISSYLLQPDRKLFLHHLWQCRQEQKELIITLRLSSKDGCERLLEFTTQPAPDLASRPGWCRSALVDVSQKRATELALSESESKFRQLAENIDEVFWFIALDPSRATYVSPAFEHIWGVSAAELYADFSVWERSVHPDDLLAVQAAFRAWISGEASSHRSEYRILHPSGQIRWISDRGIVIRSHQGRPTLLSGIARDITERKLAEQKFHGLLEAAPEAMIVVNPKGHIELVNAQAVKLFNYSHAELVGQPMEMLLPEGFPVGQQADFAAAPTPRAVGANRELFARRKDGSEFPTEISLSPLPTAQGQLVISAVRDITQRKQAEAEVRKSEERFRGFFDNVAVGTVQVDGRGEFVRINDRYCEITGYSRRELLGGMGPLQLRHPENFVDDNEHLAPFLRGKTTSYESEKQLIRKDGSVAWIHITASSSPDANGNATNFTAVVEDITARKRVEADLRESEQRFRGFFENVNIGASQLNAEGKFSKVNDRLCAITGYSREELLSGMSPLDLDHPDEREFNRERLLRYCSGGYPTFDAEKRYIRKDGSSVWVHVSASTIFNADGTFRYGAGLIEDITARKEAEAALRASEERLRQFVSHSPAPVAMFDLEMRYLVVSKRWLQDFHTNNEDLIGRSHYEAVPDLPERWKEVHQRCLAGACESCERDKFPRGSGAVDWVKWEVRPWLDAQGAIGGMILFAETINEQVQMEESLRQLNEELEMRVSERTASLRLANQELHSEITKRQQLEQEVLNISEREQVRIGQDLHDDLGQQLAGIALQSAVLRRNLAKRQDADAEHAAQITELLKGAMALTRSLARGLHPVAIETGGIVSALHELAKRTREMLCVDCRCQCPPHIELDIVTATHLYRIAQEAVTNAVKHGCAREIDLQLTTAKHSTVLSIKDCGCGLSKLDPHHIGMGLRIMQYRADIIGGTLKMIHHQPAPGLTVICTIPNPDP